MSLCQFIDPITLQKCTIHARFGPFDGLKQHCTTHRLATDILLTSEPMCKESGCTTRASFGVINKRATHCNTHKLDNEINVTYKRCIEKDCENRAYYGTIKRQYCKTHRKTDDKFIGLQLCKLCETVGSYRIVDPKTKKEMTDKYCVKHKPINAKYYKRKNQDID